MFMKYLNRIFVALTAFAAMMACSGNVDEKTPEHDYDVPEGVLRIFADKEKIAADGADKVTFTVAFGSSDVSEMPGMTISVEKDGRKTALAEGTNVFTATQPGEYVFTATYDYGGVHRSDNAVKVTAERSGGQLSSGYRQKMIAMQFTSTGCVNCPILSEAIKNIRQNHPDRIIPVAFHMDYDVADPMTLSINEKFYRKVSDRNDYSIGLPMFAFNFRKSSQHIINEYAKIESELQLESELYPPVCGVSLETSYDESSRKVQIKAGFKSDVSADYRYHIFLVEDGVEYPQMGDDTGNYVHNNVLRHVCSDNVLGVKIEKGALLEPGKEYLVERSVTLDEGWDSSKIRVVAAMLCSSDRGETYYSNNANECPLGGSSDYLYENE